MISVRFQGKPFNIMIIQVYALISNAEFEWFSEDLQDLLELTSKKDVFFIIGDWNAKVGSQEISGLTGKFALRVGKEQGKAHRGYPRERTGHCKHSLPTIQDKTLHMDITRWLTHGISQARILEWVAIPCSRRSSQPRD